MSAQNTSQVDMLPARRGYDAGRAPAPSDDGMLTAPTPSFAPIPDRYKTQADVVKALRRGGLESSDLIIGIDFTPSNKSQGKRTFGGRSLHDVSGRSNPYQEVIRVMGKTLSEFDDDNMIPVYGFGNERNKREGYFEIRGSGPNGECHGYEEVLTNYTTAVRQRGMQQQITNFAPVINKAIEIVKEEKSYHILVIVADGGFYRDYHKPYRAATEEAIVRASNYALSIVVVGVGDGPWELMEEFDDELPARKFDNFQFVNWEEVKENAKSEAAFALAALMEIPDQYKLIQKLGYLGEQS